MPKYSVKERGWSQLSVTYYDVAGQNKEIWDWILSEPCKQTIGTLQYFDGSGRLLEELILRISPCEIMFSNPDYSSSDPAEITIVFKTLDMKRVVHI